MTVFLMKPLLLQPKSPLFFSPKPTMPQSQTRQHAMGPCFTSPSSQPGSLLGGDRPNICFAWHYCGQALTGEARSSLNRSFGFWCLLGHATIRHFTPIPPSRSCLNHKNLRACFGVKLHNLWAGLQKGILIFDIANTVSRY